MLEQIAAGLAGMVLAGTAWKVAIAPAISALRSAVRKLDAIDELLSRELEHNHGGSIKDDVHGIAVAQGHTQRRVDQLVAALRRHHPDDPMFWKEEKR